MIHEPFTARLVIPATADDECLQTRVPQLKQAGRIVVTATGIEDVLRQLETMPDLPAASVIDFPLRRSGNVDALQRLRTNRHSASIPLILLDRGDSALLPEGSFVAILPAAAAGETLIDALARAMKITESR